MKCQYCDKILSSLSALNTHQKTTKYCLLKQGKNITNGQFNCDICKKYFYNKQTLEKHNNICILNNPFTKNLQLEIIKYKEDLQLSEEKNNMLEEKVYLLKKDKEKLIISNQKLNLFKQQILLLEQKVLMLEKDKENVQEKYDELAKISARKSTNTHINNIKLSVFKNDEDIKKIVDEKYNAEFLLEGQKGVARFTNSHVLNKEMYVITDKNRGNGKYKISDNEIVTDIGMIGLTKKVHPSIKTKAVYLVSNDNTIVKNEELLKNYQEIFNMDDDNSVFKRELIRLRD